MSNTSLCWSAHPTKPAINPTACPSPSHLLRKRLFLLHALAWLIAALEEEVDDDCHQQALYQQMPLVLNKAGRVKLAAWAHELPDIQDGFVEC
jgi:hypothetical protein